MDGVFLGLDALSAVAPIKGLGKIGTAGARILLRGGGTAVRWSLEGRISGHATAQPPQTDADDRGDNH